jgi:hypothetical protein
MVDGLECHSAGRSIYLTVDEDKLAELMVSSVCGLAIARV